MGLPSSKILKNIFLFHGILKHRVALVESVPDHAPLPHVHTSFLHVWVSPGTSPMLTLILPYHVTNYKANELKTPGFSWKAKPRRALFVTQERAKFQEWNETDLTAYIHRLHSFGFVQRPSNPTTGCQ